MYILLEYTRIIKPLSQCFDTQTIVIIIHRGRDVKILLLTILLDIVFKTMKINKIHYKVSKIPFNSKIQPNIEGLYISFKWLDYGLIKYLVSNVYTDIKCLAHNRRKEACYNYIIIIYLDMLDILDMRIY